MHGVSIVNGIIMTSSKRCIRECPHLYNMMYWHMIHALNELEVDLSFYHKIL